MKYYLIAGEKSGELHASNLMKSILEYDSEAEFRYWGGEEMQKVGGTLVRHYNDMAFMGFVEVLKNLKKIKGFMKEAQQDILEYAPDVVILVDYGGFNMRMSAWCKQNNVTNYYYITPKVWAWNTKRAKKIKKNVDRMFVIFPFEKTFFKKYDYDVDYVGNPILDAIKAYQPNPSFFQDHGLSKDQKIIAILPGSRKQEIALIFETMLSVIQQFPEYQFVVGGLGRLPKHFYDPCQNLDNVTIVYDQTYDLLSHAHAALVTSGTATLETALFSVPQVVCYKASAINYQIANYVAQVDYISLVNLVMNRTVVTELIQKKYTSQNLEKELRLILEGPARDTMLQEYKALQDLLGTDGASKMTAQLMVQYLKEG